MNLSILTSYGDYHAIKLQSDGELDSAQIETTQGYEKIDSSSFAFINMLNINSNVSIYNLPKQAKVFDQISESLTQTTLECGTINLKPTNNKNWISRFKDVFEIIKKHSNLFEYNSVICLIDIPNSCEILDVIYFLKSSESYYYKSNVIELQLVDIDFKFIFVINNQEVTYKLNGSYKRKRFDIELFNDIKLEEFFDIISPPLNVNIDLGSFFNIVFGSSKMVKSMDHNKTFKFPDNCIITDKTLTDTSNNVTDLSFGLNSSTIKFTVKDSEEWYILIICKKNYTIDDNSSIESLWLKYIIESIDEDVSTAYNMMIKHEEMNKLFKSHKFMKNIWNSQISKITAKWNSVYSKYNMSYYPTIEPPTIPRHAQIELRSHRVPNSYPLRLHSEPLH